MAEITTTPKSSFGDYVHLVTRTGISLIPIAGGPALEIFNAIIAPPLERRRDEWLKQLAEGIAALQEQVDGLSPEKLSQNDAFISTALQASATATRNHHKEKLEALRNAVLNSALASCPEEETRLLFLAYIEALTPLQVRMLRFFQDPAGYGAQHHLAYPDLVMGSISDLLDIAFPEWKRVAAGDHLIRDLYNRGLININSVGVAMSSQGLVAPRITQAGDAFLEFITSPLPSCDGQ